MAHCSAAGDILDLVVGPAIRPGNYDVDHFIAFVAGLLVGAVVWRDTKAGVEAACGSGD